MVFSKPEAIRQINANFVPVALKAGLINNPPGGKEGRLYRQIAESRPAPQGICVANSAGKPLDWALSFKEEDSILDFLSHSLERYAEFPDDTKPVAVERYMRFPTQRLLDASDPGSVAVAERHTPGEFCPAKPPLEPGTLVGQVVGRALDSAGKPMGNVVKQEYYAEDRFEVPVAMQKQVAELAGQAGGRRFGLPKELSRLLVSGAYLGMLDVSPLGGWRVGGETNQEEIELSAQSVAEKKGKLLHIEGRSEVAGHQATNSRRGGRRWQHHVKLDWEGFIELEGSRIARLLMRARGDERLKWDHGKLEWDKSADASASENQVASLMAGRPIDLTCGVVYGLAAKPADPSETFDRTSGR